MYTHHTYDTRPGLIELCVFVYVAGIRKKLLSHCSVIYTFHLHLKHPLCSNLWIQTKRYDCYCPGLGTTKLPLFMQDLPWSPHVCMEFMESDLHPSVNQLRNIDLTASSPLVQPPRALPPSALTSANPYCLQLQSPASQSHIPAFDLGPFQKTSAWPRFS